MTIKIQTLDEILAQLNLSSNSNSSAAQAVHSNPKPAKTPTRPNPSSNPTPKTPNRQKSRSPNSAQPTPPISPRSKPKKPAPTAAPNPLSFGVMETDKSSDDRQAILTALANTERQTLYETDREHNYLRWLAFYYLSKRELSKNELKQKLINKGFEESTVLPLLAEFAEKDYQSDYRYATMTVREAIRTGKGKQAIAQKFYKAKLNLASLGLSLDELIDTARQELTDGTSLEEDEDVNWLKLAVETRCKKYGHSIPKDPKEKARQLRFLQYRGFEMGVCFDALKLTMEDFDE